jgi:hypothetical protein
LKALVRAWCALFALVAVSLVVREAHADLPNLVVTIANPAACPGFTIGATPTTSPYDVQFVNTSASPAPMTIQNFSASGSPIVFSRTIPAGGTYIYSPTFTGEAYICGPTCCPVPPQTVMLTQVGTVPTNGCRINTLPGQGLTIKGPGYPTATQVALSIDYEEPIPQLSTQATDFRMTVSASPSADAATLLPPWLLGPATHTMGANEGPNQLGSVGDGGHISIKYGPCGDIEDDFSVTSVQPYLLTHNISGNLDLSGFNGLQSNTALFRNVVARFTATGGTGTVKLGVQSTNAVVCTGQLTITYTAAHPTVSLPVSYQSNIVFDSFTPDGAMTGTRTRIIVPSVPATPPFVLGVGAALFALGALGVLARRRLKFTAAR